MRAPSENKLQKDTPARGLPALPSEGTPMAAAHPRLAALRELLDPRFGDLGLLPVPQPAGVSASYAGEIDGRAVRVTCSVRTTHRQGTSGVGYRQFAGLNLEISVDTLVRTHLIVSPPLSESLAGADNVVVRGVIWAGERFHDRRAGLTRLAAPTHEGPALRARATDPSWARAFLTPEICRELQDLLPPRDLGALGPLGKWSLSFASGTMGLSLTPEASTLSSPHLARWLQTALRLVREAERHRPSDPAPSIQPEREVRSASVPGQVDVRKKVFLAVGCLATVPFLLLAGFAAGFLFFGERVMLVPIVFAFFLMPYGMYLLLRNRVRSIASARRRAGAPHWSELPE